MHLSALALASIISAAAGAPIGSNVIEARQADLDVCVALAARSAESTNADLNAREAGLVDLHICLDALRKRQLANAELAPLDGPALDLDPSKRSAEPLRIVLATPALDGDIALPLEARGADAEPAHKLQLELPVTLTDIAGGLI
jgi:hypothetical protein